MLPVPPRPVVATHWGTYRARMAGGRAVALEPLGIDPEPSPIAGSMIPSLDDSARVRKPSVRASFLERGHRASGEGRGSEPFVEIDWPEAVELVAREIRRVREDFGNRAIYGGSYGWASAGRFHHAQSQIHRFLNVAGGYTRSVRNYSFAAADTILPHVIGDNRGLALGHTTWSGIADHAQTIVAFGGVSQKNSQVSAGGMARHGTMSALATFRRNGGHLVSVSPIADDSPLEATDRWLPVRPGTDVALMLGLAHTLLVHGLHDEEFLARCTSGFERFRSYLDGSEDGLPKSAAWAARLCGIGSDDIVALARRMAQTRTIITVSWSLQRADHGEQPCWMAIALAAMLGQIGLPGGGFGFGYGSSNGIGNQVLDVAWPSLPQGANPVADYIPVARISDMLLNPGQLFDYNGHRLQYPDIRLVYWAGGNPFHHHQDINRLLQAWKRPETIVVHESWWNALARHADIVLPVSTQLERNDLVFARRDHMIAASHRIAEPHGDSRSDYEIFADIADALGVREAFTEARDEEAWLRHFFQQASARLAIRGVELPAFEEFWRDGLVVFPEISQTGILLKAFRDDPLSHPLATPSGLIEIFSEKISGFGYRDCIGHPAWLEPKEWLGSADAQCFPLHLISNQPRWRLHSQYDNGPVSRARKVRDREPLRINPRDAAARGIADGDLLRVFNRRGACLAGAVVCASVMPGVVQLSTGAWYDPQVPGQIGSLDKHGNPNVLTRDEGTSRLAQGPSAQSCLVEVERYDAIASEVTAFRPPPFEKRLRA